EQGSASARRGARPGRERQRGRAVVEEQGEGQVPRGGGQSLLGDNPYISLADGFLVADVLLVHAAAPGWRRQGDELRQEQSSHAERVSKQGHVCRRCGR